MMEWKRARADSQTEWEDTDMKPKMCIGIMHCAMFDNQLSCTFLADKYQQVISTIPNPPS